jgi:hypothetical protein
MKNRGENTEATQSISDERLRQIGFEEYRNVEEIAMARELLDLRARQRAP